jgi:AraC family transcriptional regulator of adaptative response/methylated-DNA-[protein]-cysteine methyltransferase
MTSTETPADRLNEQRWKAVQDRDASRDGAFFYGVLTTGVYCRPSCPSRRPKRENVKFYNTPAEAARDGLRPCLRCRPLSASVDLPRTKRIRDLCDYIERNAAEPLTLADLSKQAQLSPYHLQRSFKSIVGISPKQYLENCRMKNFKAILRGKNNDSVTGAIYAAGYGSSSRLYERTDTRLGMTPMEYRAGGAGLEITYGAAETPLGLMMMAATDRGLCFVHFGETLDELQQALAAEYPKSRLKPMEDPPPPEFHQWMEALNRHAEGMEPDSRLPVHVRATAFQMKVWKYLQTIPSGSVRSYQEVARGIGEPRSVRAVAKACSSNRVALAIPCHRVIRSTGGLGGYRWGLERKRVLIDNERHARAS